MLGDAKPSEIIRDAERMFRVYRPAFLSHGFAVALLVVMANTTDLRCSQIIAWDNVLTLMRSQLALRGRLKNHSYLASDCFC